MKSFAIYLVILLGEEKKKGIKIDYGLNLYYLKIFLWKTIFFIFFFFFDSFIY